MMDLGTGVANTGLDVPKCERRLSRSWLRQTAASKELDRERVCLRVVGGQKRDDCGLARAIRSQQPDELARDAQLWMRAFGVGEHSPLLRMLQAAVAP